MKCKQCNAEFTGKFCPECGHKAEAEAPVVDTNVQQSAFGATYNTTSNVTSNKKPFYLKWWFILFVIVAIVSIVTNRDNKNEKIVWNDIVLGSILPEPPVNKGEIHTNSADELLIDVVKLSDKQYADYIQTCKESGFTVDSKSDSSTYVAYNGEGYKLSLSHYGSDANMRINLKTPMEFKNINWPASNAGKKIPAPKSTTGKFAYEYDDHFLVYIGHTTKADYDIYVDTCFNSGFNVDYDKGENYYYADNSEGWHISLRYEGNNIMSVEISVIDKDNNVSSSIATTVQTTAKTTVKNSSGGLSKDFKEAMDSYEKFMDEYVAFMKKYSKNPNDKSLINDYFDYMDKYADFVEDFEKWEDVEMNAEETAYYIKVQSRVNKKLLEVAY